MSIAVQADAGSSTSHTLLERVRQQQPEAWERFTRLYGPLVYRWCTTNGLQASDAADVVQEVFHAVFQGIARFQRQNPGESVRGWLWTITRNKICDHFRRLANEPAATGGSEATQWLDRSAALPETADEPVERVGAELVHRALGLLQTDFETKTWQAFWAMAVDGEPASEAAKRLQMTVAAVYKAKSRVLHRLRTELDGLVE
jgi:RNA polymerase sigma-70 factor (ECF subfamily)